jgi:hypothetical protein
MACTVTAGPVKTDIPEASGHPTGQPSDGVIGYVDEGLFSVRYAGRKDAHNKMHRHCGGPYQIVEEVAQRGGCLQPAQRRIRFKCVDSGKAAVEEGVSRG